MNVGEQLRSLTTDAPPGDLETGHSLYREGRRRLVRRRSIVAGGGLAAVALLVAVAAPLLSPSQVIIEGGFAEQPEQLPPADPSELEEGAEPDEETDPDGEAEQDPDGAPGTAVEEPEETVERTSTTVEVGEVSLTIPAAFEVVPTSPDDPTPCLGSQDEPTFFHAPDGAPAYPDGQCPEGDPTTPSVLATTATTVPPAWLPGEGQGEMTAEWLDIEIDGVEAQRATDPNMPGLLIIRSVTLDLYLEVAGEGQDPQLIEELLASIRRS